mmetsp:Transcript_36875/g.75566  ORF Transcript_36875/g.75566 Transcript_36875/m.75566 type:complete len:226 (+) Transcript_36875:766-1443(+)
MVVFSARTSGPAKWHRACPICRQQLEMDITSQLGQPAAASARGHRSTSKNAKQSGDLRDTRGKTARAVVGWPTGRSLNKFFATWIPVASRGRGLWRIRTATNRGVWDVSSVIEPSWRGPGIKVHPGPLNLLSQTSRMALECQGSCSSPCTGMVIMPGSRPLVAVKHSWCFRRTRSMQPQQPQPRGFDFDIGMLQDANDEYEWTAGMAGACRSSCAELGGSRLQHR